MTKKKKIIIISVCVILVAAIAITVGVVCSKKNKDNTDAGEETQIVAVTDENGETVTDENGETVTEIEHIENDASNGNSSGSNQGGQGSNNSGNSGDSSNGSSGGSSGGNSSGGLQETTEPPTHYTTMTDEEKNMLPEDSFDETIPQFNALLFLQEYYGSDYVVNYDNDNTTDETYAFTIFEKSGDGTKIAYTVTVHNISGKTIQTDSKGKSTDISDKITY